MNGNATEVSNETKRNLSMKSYIPFASQIT
jgi:hypothetical protein